MLRYIQGIEICWSRARARARARAWARDRGQTWFEFSFIVHRVGISFAVLAVLRRVWLWAVAVLLFCSDKE